MNERFIGPAFIAAIACAIGMMVTFVVKDNNGEGTTQLLGLFLGGAFLFIGVAITLWGKHYMDNTEVLQERHEFEDTKEQEELNRAITTEITEFGRRKFLSRLGVASMGALGIAALFPLRALGPGAGDSLFHTKWTSGARLVDHEGKRVRATDLNVGAILTVFPEGVRPDDPSATLLIRVPSEEFKPLKDRENWIVDGNVAYSKVCTHVGCPVSLYRETTKQLLCPCHQSTFDVLTGANPTFGPASRALPQLPLAVDDEGYLYAQSDYREPVGPGFWNRTKKMQEV